MTNIIKTDTAISLPVILIDDTDFKTEETGVPYNADGLLVKYRKPENPTTWFTKFLNAANWTELGHGVYLVSFTSAEIGSTSGLFIYYCTATGILPYYGSAYVSQSNLDDLKAKLDKHDKKITGLMVVF